MRAAAEADLVTLVAVAGGRDGLLACGPLSVDATRPAGEVRPRLAWMLGLPMTGVRNTLDNGPGTTLVRAGTLHDHTLAARLPESPGRCPHAGLGGLRRALPGGARVEVRRRVTRVRQGCARVPRCP